MSLTLYMVMSEVAAAGMMMMGVREGRLPPAGARAAAAGSSCRAGALAAGPLSEHIQWIYLSYIVINTERKRKFCVEASGTVAQLGQDHETSTRRMNERETNLLKLLHEDYGIYDICPRDVWVYDYS